MKHIKLIGDDKCIGNGYAYQSPITIEYAQEMVNLLCLEFETRKYQTRWIKVENGRRTKNRHGTAHLWTGRIVLNKPTEGCLIHELAHFLANTPGHTKEYKVIQAKIYKAWYGRLML